MNHINNSNSNISTLPRVQAMRAISKESVDSLPLSTSSSPSSTFPSPATGGPIVHIDCYTDPDTHKEFVLWEDILLAFKDAVHVRHGSRIVPFSKGADFRTYVLLISLHLVNW